MTFKCFKKNQGNCFSLFFSVSLTEFLEHGVFVIWKYFILNRKWNEKYKKLKNKKRINWQRTEYFLETVLLLVNWYKTALGRWTKKQTKYDLKFDLVRVSRNLSKILTRKYTLKNKTRKANDNKNAGVKNSQRTTTTTIIIIIIIKL